MKPFKQLPCQLGLSLIELLVALALSLTLIAGVLGVFMGMFQADRSQQGVSLMQESGRFAMNFLAQDLRMAGYLGCSSTLPRDQINNTLNGPPVSFQPQRNIQGWEANNSDPGTISNSVANQAVVTASAAGWGTTGGNVLPPGVSALPGTDMFRVWGADPVVDAIVNSVSPGAATVVNVNANAGVAINDILLISDCEVADLVQACNVQEIGNPATLNLVLSAGCSPGNVASMRLLSGPGSRVMRMGGTLYYIGKRGNVATNPPALFRMRLGGNGLPGAAEELVEGVENMQILYGENTNSDSNNAADRYVPADQVSNWDRVVAARITLLVQSVENNLVPAPMAYTYNGIVYDGSSGNGNLPPDRRLRRIFTTTINLRNVTLGSGG